MASIDDLYLADLCESVFIPRAERYFGPRDPNWRIGQICRNPYGDFPQIQLFPQSGYVDIYLSSRLNDGDLTAIRLELAHECVHVLDPNPAYEGTFLCEGLATWCQIQEKGDWRPTDLRYLRALEAVERLMPRLRDAVRDRRKHRQIPMYRIRSHHLEPFFLNVTNSIANDLRLLESPFPHN